MVCNAHLWSREQIGYQGVVRVDSLGCVDERGVFHPRTCDGRVVRVVVDLVTGINRRCYPSVFCLMPRCVDEWDAAARIERAFRPMMPKLFSGDRRTIVSVQIDGRQPMRLNVLDVRGVIEPR